MIDFKCPLCGANVSASDYLSGAKTVCPACQQKVDVPTVAASSNTPPLYQQPQQHQRILGGPQANQYAGPQQYPPQAPQFGGVPGYQQPYQSQDNPTGKATASMVLGLVGIVAWLIPIVGVAVTITGLALGVKGLKSSSRGMAMTGVILSAIFLAVSVAHWIYNIVVAVNAGQF